MVKLNRLNTFAGSKGPLLLIIMDGIGLGLDDESNAVHIANTPNLDMLFSSKFCTSLAAHGKAVGLPSDKDMGNSEVGHNALGAGRVFVQGAKRVNADFESGSIFNGHVWKQIVETGENGGAVHFIGLLSDANVHSNTNHLYAMINKLAELGIKRVRVHSLLDGRDVAPQSALDYIGPTEELLKKIRDKEGFDYVIASGGGRMNVTMDRYGADWNIVKRGWDAHVNGIGRYFKSCEMAIRTFYEEGVDDQYMDAFVIVDGNDKPVGIMEDGDSVILYNFRGDRSIEISQAFDAGDGFDKFDRVRVPNVFFAGIMAYDSDAKIPFKYLVEPPLINNVLSEYLVHEGVRMFAVSETQKFGHVTYFWNGNKSGYINDKLETYIEIPSDKIPFDRAPEMKAVEITDKTIELLKSGNYDFGRLNFANGDMVGHTGVAAATVQAVNTVDKCVGRLLDVVKELGGIVIVTADHGNADELFVLKDGKKVVKTSHSLNRVPFIITDYGCSNEYVMLMPEIKNAGLSNVAATICNLLGYEKPEDYDQSLVTFG
ncbi:MAG: 2,3-bisphosphoglycerate-independent phosphoglycerate mutase [Candidatus Anammoxibacter sp.]